ncbi:formylglycine-generating enzyme family protein [Methylococcaceae bacterium WWC4]|nr:formylglycine-generating enzyme family protein [Methylococcaceae bacterium WWC4]
MTKELSLLPANFPPPWASAWGEDGFGLFAELHYLGVIQRFRWLLPGSFWMGSPPDEPGREPWDDSKETRHWVRLSQGYWLADTACTQALWRAVMGENSSRFDDDPGKPVETVSWLDVQIFIDWLNRQVGGLRARLPSEAEWEYACRAGTETPFSFGDNVSPWQVNYNGDLPYPGAEIGEYWSTTVAVKSLPANPWGLYEMHGNVWEWCRDGWREDLGNIDITDPLFDPTDQGVDRVLRGGCWSDFGGFVRSAVRSGCLPGVRDYNIGFRLALG